MSIPFKNYVKNLQCDESIGSKTLLAFFECLSPNNKKLYMEHFNSSYDYFYNHKNSFDKKLFLEYFHRSFRQIDVLENSDFEYFLWCLLCLEDIQMSFLKALD